MKTISLLLFLLVFPFCLLGQQPLDKLKLLPEITNPYSEGVKEDWLIAKPETNAKAFRNSKGNELILSNGLISRTFRIAPNAATVSFKKLQNQEELIRAVKPEAILSINNFSIPVGGLEGQPNLAFLYEDWIDQLKVTPGSFQLKDYTLSPIEKRLDWLRIYHHDTDAEWPPKGIHLKMIYDLENLSAEELIAKSNDSKAGRDVLLFDNFKTLSPNWKITTSDSHERSSFINEGKPGEIFTLKNTAVYAEQKLPADVKMVEATIDPGTDRSASWAPGIALLWNDKKVKFTFQRGTETGDNDRPWKFMVFDGKREIRKPGEQSGLQFEKPWVLRLNIDGNKIHCEAKPNDGEWKRYYTIRQNKVVENPVAVRIGKLGKNVDGSDHTQLGQMVRCNIYKFVAYSKIKENKLNELNQRLNELQGLEVSVHYNLYDKIPVLSKWVELENKGTTSLKVDEIISEYLAMPDNDPYNKSGGLKNFGLKPNIHIETDYAFGGQKVQVAVPHSVHWSSDQDYHTQISVRKDIPNQVKVYPEYGYHVKLKPEEKLESIRAFLMPFDSYEQERQGLALRKMYRTIAPWVTENPMMFHLTKSGWKAFTHAIDQCEELGYEMLNFSFGSGFRAEDDSPKNLAKIEKYLSYAQSKNIGIGTYSLLASRRINDKTDVINSETGKPGGHAVFGNSPCLCSEWGEAYFQKMYKILGKNKLQSFTHDGSYPGDQCASEIHLGHSGLEDSQYLQWKKITDFYKWCKANGVNLRIPDYYYLTGGNQCAIGYREANWSLPRREQLVHTRQHMYDGTWHSTPGMRWSFIPLSQYKGGGKAATVAPLYKHLDHYEMMLASNLGMGIQSVLRGPELYDTPETKTMVKRMTAWYKKYRPILESDILHLRKADGRDIDYMMHVNPELKEKGFLMVFNPTNESVIKTIKVPLYYTGLTEYSHIREQEGEAVKYKLGRDYSAEIEVKVKPNWYNWYVIE